MKNKTLFWIFPLLLIAPFWAFSAFEHSGPSPAAAAYQSLIPHPQDHTKWFIATEKEVLEKSFLGPSERLDGARGAERIRKLIDCSGSGPVFFAITDREIIRYRIDQAKRDRIFELPSSTEHLLSFTAIPGDADHWLVGTSSGLQESDDAGRIWYPFPYFRNQPVEVLKCANAVCFLGSGSKFYRSENLSDFRLVLTAPDSQEREAATSENDDLSDALENPQAVFHDLWLPASGNAPFYLASSRGVFESRDQGVHWQRLSGSGLTGPTVRYLARSEKSGALYAANQNSIFRWLPGAARWTTVETPAAAGPLTEIRGLGIAEQVNESLAVLTSMRFFQIPVLGPEISVPALSLPSQNQMERWNFLRSLEPPIQEVHQNVIRYADVGNGKISGWHAGSRLAALLPSFSFGKDLSRSTSLSTASGKFYEGPDDFTRGWDADLSWDLGDFIWSSAQTSIDSRQKMMVELRQDLLAEATRLYFERRRLQQTLYLEASLEEPMRRETALHIEELTALLDGMTGGWFGEQIQKSQVRERDKG